MAVTDEQILAMQRRLAGEGVWVEPASAAGLAGLAAEISAGRLDLQGKKVVAVCTGHGLKDPDIITGRMSAPAVIPASLAALEALLPYEVKIDTCRRGNNPTHSRVFLFNRLSNRNYIVDFSV